MVHALLCTAIYQSKIAFDEGFWRERIVIELKAASESPTAVKYERTHHGGSRVAMLLENLRDRDKLRIQRLSGKIPHSILKRISAGQNHCMRWPRKWNLRNGALEDDAVAGQGIQCWCLHRSGAVRSRVVGAYRVDRDENDICRDPAIGISPLNGA